MGSGLIVRRIYACIIWENRLMIPMRHLQTESFVIVFPRSLKPYSTCNKLLLFNEPNFLSEDVQSNTGVFSTTEINRDTYIPFVFLPTYISHQP